MESRNIDKIHGKKSDLLMMFLTETRQWAKNPTSE